MSRWLIVCLVLVTQVAAAEPFRSSGGKNAARHFATPSLVLVSIDGFGAGMLSLREARNLRRIAAEGVRAERLLPVFPTLTFPNHYSIVTGLFPARHGIVANDFPLEDGSWYRIRIRPAVADGANYSGVPVWVAAESQGMVSASFFWVGSEADIRGVRPTHFRVFDKNVKPRKRVSQVLKWLREPASTRPRFISMYFEQVDDNSHWYGPGSSKALDAVARIDRQVGRLYRGIRRLGDGNAVNLVIVSDHGQATHLPQAETFSLAGRIDLEGIQPVDGDSYLFLYFDHPDQQRAASIRDRVNAAWKHGRAFTSEDAPPAWQISGSPRFPDVLLVADVGYRVISDLENAGDAHPGDHGWRPEAPEMHGIFIANGPSLRRGVETGPVRNIDLYPMLLKVLGLEAMEAYDGDPEALAHVLR
ncbi:MAG: ectonucleotide pyrophosphatase/phosphodiesterase [Xanthomonadales bacterium]|nr:ectonucleotide pyrophosphatase/phosphodiesterase [Xanthomonadales bacterium]